MLALGLMSGTSLDGVDAALVVTDGVGVERMGPSLTRPYPADTRSRLRAVLGGIGPVAEVEDEITRIHAEVVQELLVLGGLEPAEVDVIGFHGHTILHRPEQRRTWQIGDGRLLADLTGIPVVNDFRTADVAAGGQGAPLVPVFHRALAAGIARPVAVLNLGGVGNVTWIGEDDSLLAFDTGPGNALIDDWAMAHTGRPVDENGALARAGRTDAERVEQFSRHPYFAQRPPKSLDRDDFRHFAASLVEGMNAADGAATLTAFTACAVAQSRAHFPKAAVRWLVCGGGRHNPAVMAALAAELGVPVEPVESVGWDGDALEAQAFAYLAVRSLRGLPLTYPETTGGPAASCGGRFHALS
ncbi:MAG TPA: anhydro-N-acetylmuramic acid kinase [Magnetospirillum sp.]|nr:anhydro-N-acetylmuramic acid kinase [Magnetospirillum sp.]